FPRPLRKGGRILACHLCAVLCLRVRRVCLPVADSRDRTRRNAARFCSTQDRKPLFAGPHFYSAARADSSLCEFAGAHRVARAFAVLPAVGTRLDIVGSRLGESGASAGTVLHGDGASGVFRDSLEPKAMVVLLLVSGAACSAGDVLSGAADY